LAKEKDHEKYLKENHEKYGIDNKLHENLIDAAEKQNQEI